MRRQRVDDEVDVLIAGHEEWIMCYVLLLCKGVVMYAGTLGTVTRSRTHVIKVRGPGHSVYICGRTPSAPPVQP